MTRVHLATYLLAATLAGAGTAAWAASGPCTVATKGSSLPAKACATGGRKEAKRVMTEMVNKAKAKGMNFECSNCHKDMDSYELTANARDDLKKLEAVQKK